MGKVSFHKKGVAVDTYRQITNYGSTKLAWYSTKACKKAKVGTPVKQF